MVAMVSLPYCRPLQARKSSVRSPGAQRGYVSHQNLRSSYPVSVQSVSLDRGFGLRSFPGLQAAESTIEPVTKVCFPRRLKLPGCSDRLVLVGTGIFKANRKHASIYCYAPICTDSLYEVDFAILEIEKGVCVYKNLKQCWELFTAGYREKVFAIIGVKVYASGFYASRSIKEILISWKEKSVADIEADSTLFRSIYEAPSEKTLRIELLRDVDGNTFWSALDEAISPRIKKPTAEDVSAISTFRNTFQGRDLKKGTFIYLTWVGSSNMLVSISSDAFPSNVDAEIDSLNMTLALYDAFLGDSTVSPTLKASVAHGLKLILNEN